MQKNTSFGLAYEEALVMGVDQVPPRSDPDVLLSAISKKWSKKKGGRLFLFIGMAPGVGKTYSMLLAAKDSLKNGMDTVVGVVETHGRIETEQLLVGLESIPRKKLIHRDREFYEMDLDAILQRKPSIVLVDELAHTNIPGSRHTKRWQDVFELLDAGIDVYSTINVQHLESRKDTVEKIANITISETVPDSVLDRAFQIQLIDLSATDLIRRLKEGKVYIGDKADLAAANFFKEEKLTALREIALRVAAERVDAELQTFADVREAGTPWAVTERLMVAVGFGQPAEKLIRATRRMAYNLDAPWIAVHISLNELSSEEDKVLLAKNLELARNLGAEVVTLADTSLLDGLIRLARQKDVSQIIVGRSKKRFLGFMFGWRPLHDELIAKSSIDVCVVSTEQRKVHDPLNLIGFLKTKSTVFSYLKALAFTIILLSCNALIEPFIGYRAVGFLLLVGILAVGLFMPIGPVLCASIITMIGWNFFFIPPVGTFHIKSTEDLFLSISYLVAALATGILTRRNKYQQEILVAREIRSQSLNQILLNIATKTTVKDMCDSVLKSLSTLLQGDCDVVLVKKDKSLSLMGTNLQFSNMNREMAVAKWSIENNKIAGRMTDTLSSAEALFVPLKGSFEMMGALAFKSKKAKPLSLDDMEFLYTVAHQLGLSLEKQQFRTMALAKERLAESEKLHQTLIEALVREIKGAVSPEEARALIFIADNFAIVSRLLAGIYPLKKEPCQLEEIVEEACDRARLLIPTVSVIAVQKEKNMPQVNLERDLMVQSFANIIFNGLLHAHGKDLVVQVLPKEVVFLDNGPGVPEEDLGRIFEKLYRGEQSTGYGLGLAVAKGVIKAHEGKISAKNRPTGGLMITVNLA